MTDQSVPDLLARLSTPQAGAAWKEFVDHYAHVIMHIVRRHEGSDDERANDCFVYVCGALSDDGFRRLKTYRPERRVRFTTWLMAVVSNLCVDYRRKREGRIRPARAVTRLSELEQLVYRHIFVRGMPRTQCLNVLRPKFPELTESSIADINARLFGMLTPKQRFRLSSRALAASSRGPAAELDEEDFASRTPDSAPEPPSLAEDAEASERLHAALTKLPPMQRLLLRLRFEQNLTLAEVARLTCQPDPFRAKRQIQAAVTALHQLMEDPGLPRKK
jgi:RNA polymerase sigma factor (sigma-70 family)